MAQWLGLHAFTAMGRGSIPGHGTKILQAAWHSKLKKEKKKNANWKERNKTVTLTIYRKF